MDSAARSILVCKEWNFLEGRSSSAWRSLAEGDTWKRGKKLGAENSLYLYRLAQWICRG